MKHITRLKNWLFKIYILIQTATLSIPRKNWVSYHARKLIRESQSRDRKSFVKKLSEWWFELMHPTRWRTSLLLAFTVVLLPQLLIGLLLQVKLLPTQLFAFLDTDFSSTTWQVLASIIGISFVIVVFLTEYSQDRGYERRAFPIYVSATSMIFTVMVGLLTLMSMGINFALIKSPISENAWILGASAGNSLLFLINLMLTLILYVRTYQLLSPSYFREILVQYHRRKVLDRVYQELFKRVKQNVSINFIDSLGIEASLWKSEFPGKVPVKIQEKISEPHVVLDLNLDLVEFASKNAKKLLKAFEKDKFEFVGIPGHYLPVDNPAIAAIIPEFVQKQIVIPLRQAVHILPWKSAKFNSADEDLLINRDLVSSAITSGQADNVESALDLYIETITAFLDSLRQLGYRFTPQMADNERGWFNRWEIFETVHQHYVSLLRDALKSNHTEIINRFVSFPRRVMTLALDYQDHLAFRNFADLYPVIYSLAKQYVTDNRTVEEITNRCGTLLAEFANYQIESQLTRRELVEEEAKELIAYVEHILVIFSQLAKYQIDNLDVSPFRLTIASIRNMLNGFASRHDELKLGQLEWQEKHVTEEAYRTEIVRELQQERLLNSLAQNLQNTRRSALFGLGAWLSHLLDSGKLTDDQFEKLSHPIGKEFGNLQYLNESYNNAITTEDRNRFHWSSWEMGEWPEVSYGEGKFGSINFSSWLTLYYAFRSLELTPENENPQAILEIKPNPNIKGNLDGLKANIKHLLETKSWETTIKRLGNIKLRSEILERSHQAAHTKQEEIEEIETTQTPLSQKKIKEFYKEVEKAWKEQGALRNLFTTFGRFKDGNETSPPNELKPFGLHQLVPKGVFIDNPRIGYPMWGESFGRSMARGEDQLISGSFSQLPSISVTTDQFDEAILRHINLLQKNNLDPVILSGHGLYRKLYESKNYEPKWRTTKIGPEGLRNLDGFYKDVAVLRPPINPNWVVIYDPSEFGDLFQYKVDEDKPDYPLAYSVKEISPERAKELFLNNPDLAKDKDTGTIPPEELALRKIEQNVELAIWQRSKVENVNTKSGFILKFVDADSNDNAVDE